MKHQYFYIFNYFEISSPVANKILFLDARAKLYVSNNMASSAIMD